MGGRLATYEDSGKVFLRGIISGVRRRSYSALQKLDTSSHLPGSDLRRDSKLPGRRNFFNDWIHRGLFGNGLRPASEEIRPVGRRLDSLLSFSTLSNNKNRAYTRKAVNQYSTKDRNRANSCGRAK